MRTWSPLRPWSLALAIGCFLLQSACDGPLSAETTTTTATASSSCQDKVTDCSVHKANGGCLDANPIHDQWRTNCVRTCGYCGNPQYDAQVTTTAPFVFGQLGIDACPTGYEPVRDEQTCIHASQHLSVPYKTHENDGANDAICNGRACGAGFGQGSGCENTRLTRGHGAAARYICQATIPGYVCETNRNYLGATTCFDDCPRLSVASARACGELCDAQAGCTVFVYNKYQQCFMKSDVKQNVDDDATHETVSCKKAFNLEIVGDGHCTGNTQIYASSAWELATSSGGHRDVNTAEYKAWVSEAWQRCLDKDAGTQFVSVWTDAGYRCYKGSTCTANGHDNIRSWKSKAVSYSYTGKGWCEDGEGEWQGNKGSLQACYDFIMSRSDCSHMFFEHATDTDGNCMCLKNTGASCSTNPSGGTKLYEIAQASLCGLQTGCELYLKQPDHSGAYLGMCGDDNSCSGSQQGVFGYLRKESRTKWHVEVEGAHVYLKQPDHSTYLGTCGNDNACGGSQNLNGVFGYSSKESRTKWHIEEEDACGSLYLMQPESSTYLGMCGNDNSCSGSNYGVFGFSSKETRTKWIIEDLQCPQAATPGISGAQISSPILSMLLAVIFPATYDLWMTAAGSVQHAT